MTMHIKNVTVIGAGAMGAQIAVHAAAMGYNAAIHDTDSEAFERTLDRLRGLLPGLTRPLIVPLDDYWAASRKVRIAPDLGEALAEADLVIETVPEELELKREVWTRIGALASQSAVLATNSSSMPVSRFEDKIPRPERCLNLHFYNPTIMVNMVDVMGGTRTAPEILEAGVAWVRSIGSVPLTVKKEVLGFCFNRVWRAIKKEVLWMWAEGVADHRDIDRGWMVANAASIGPFGRMDLVGLDVVYDIEMVYYRESGEERDRPPDRLKEMVERGDLGMKTGRGFYEYPDPEFANPAFLDADSRKE